MDTKRQIKSILISPTRHLSLQFIRYLFVGGAATVVDIGLFMLCCRLLGLYSLVSNTIGFVGGLTLNYILSTIWVFDSRNVRNHKVEFIIFAVVGLGGLLISHAVIYAGMELMSVKDFIAKPIAVIFALIWNFGIRKALLFRESNKTAEPVTADIQQD